MTKEDLYNSMKIVSLQVTMALTKSFKKSFGIILRQIILAELVI